MAVYLKASRKSEKKKSSDAVSWAVSGACFGLGIALGYGVFPAYCGIVAASQVPSISIPVLGAALTESSRIQAMTAVYNVAMTYAPVVSASSASLLKGAASFAMATPEKADDNDPELLNAITPAA